MQKNINVNKALAFGLAQRRGGYRQHRNDLLARNTVRKYNSTHERIIFIWKLLRLASLRKGDYRQQRNDLRVLDRPLTSAELPLSLYTMPNRLGSGLAGSVPKFVIF